MNGMGFGWLLRSTETQQLETATRATERAQNLYHVLAKETMLQLG